MPPLRALPGLLRAAAAPQFMHRVVAGLAPFDSAAEPSSLRGGRTNLARCRIPTRRARWQSLKLTAGDFTIAPADIALKHGTKPDEIIMSAAYPANRFTVWSGEESTRWASFVQKCRALLGGPTETHRLLGTHGVRLFEVEENRARQQERERAIYGERP